MKTKQMKKNRFTIEDEIAEAIMNSEPTYVWVVLSTPSVEERLHVPLPTPQKCGTTTQRITYARMKAQEIYDQVSQEIYAQ